MHGVWDEGAAFECEVYVAAASVEEFDAECFFKLGNATAYGGLGDVLVAGGLAEAAGLGDGEEVA